MSKEQVSVEECVDCGNVLLPLKHEHSTKICKQCEIKALNDIPHDLEWRKRHGLAKKIYVDAEEHERFKRLDENVQRRLTILRQLYDHGLGGKDANDEIKKDIRYLESLYDAN